MLELRNIAKMVGGDYHIYPTNLTLKRGTLNVLLGPTLSGKTSLMRLMAGLDKPTEGSLMFDGTDVTGKRVQDRSVAMVYQQFINYPSLSVYENIASPMRIAKKDSATIDREVRKAADLLKLTPYQERTPTQSFRRPAAAHRPCSRHRQECQPRSSGRAACQPRLQAARRTTRGVAQDLRLVRRDLCLRNHRAFRGTPARRQYGNAEPRPYHPICPTIDMYRNPVDLISARTFADPPLNIVELTKAGGSFLQNGQPAFAVPAHLSGIADGPMTAAFHHPHHLYPEPTNINAVKLQAKTLVSEIAGSESFIHLDFAGHRWVMQTRGILDIEPDRQIDIYLDTRHLMAFDVNGRSLAAPKLAAA